MRVCKFWSLKRIIYKIYGRLDLVNRMPRLHDHLQEACHSILRTYLLRFMSHERHTLT